VTSYITHVILTFHHTEDTHERMLEVNAADYRPGGLGFCAPVQCYPDTHMDLAGAADPFIGGTHNTQMPIFIGVFSYLDLEKFLTHLRYEVRWERASAVRCFVCTQIDEGFEERFQTSQQDLPDFRRWSLERVAPGSDPPPKGQRISEPTGQQFVTLDTAHLGRNGGSSLPPDGSMFVTKERLKKDGK
jgi:hypothetical protein